MIRTWPVERGRRPSHFEQREDHDFATCGVQDAPNPTPDGFELHCAMAP